MRSFRNSEIFKRVIPFTLAAIVLAGTVLGIFGTIFAYAVEGDMNVNNPDEDCNMKIIGVDFYDKSGNWVSDSKVKPDTTYKIRIRLQPETGGDFEDYDEESTNPIQSVHLNEGDFVLQTDKDTSRFEEHWDSPVKSGSKIYYLYELSNVRIKELSGNRAQLDILVDYKNSDIRTDELYAGVIIQSISTDSDNNWSDDDYGTIRNTSTNDTSDAEVLTTPKMIVTGFNIPPVVNPGEEFQVTIEFMNNSKKKDMENVSMTLSPSDGVAIKNGVNKRHYIKIPKRQSTSETFTLKSSRELKAESLSLTVKFDYQYEVDNAYKDGSSEEVLSISAVPKEEEKQEDTGGTEGSISSFEILSIVPPDSLYANEDGYVTVKVINKDHQYDASNVQLTIVGDGLVNSGNTEYHGALTHSTQAEIEMAIQFAGAGTYQLQAIVTYEDSVGKDDDGKPKVRINDLTKDFTITVLESPDMGMDMGMGDMMGIGGIEFDENGMPVGGEGMEAPAPWYKNPVILGCSGGGLVIVAVVTVLLVLRAKKKKAGEDDEDI